MRFTPANTGCAVLLIVFGALIAIGAGVSVALSNGDAIGIVVGVVMLVVGVVCYRSLKPTFHVILASAAAERQGLRSKDESLVDRVTNAITDAITYRG